MDNPFLGLTIHHLHFVLDSNVIMLILCICFRGAGDEFSESQSSKDSGYCDDESDPMRQRFSIATHPSQPIILCSDGYMVTVMAMPSHTTCLSIMRGLVTEANRHLRLIRDQHKLQMTMFETLKKQRKRQQRSNIKFGKAEKRIGLLHGLDTTAELPNIYQNYRFEKEPDGSLNKTLESDLDDVDPKGQGAMANIDFNMGKIMFGDVENMNATLDYRHLFAEEGISLAEHINRCQKGLILAWGLAATHSGHWTIDHEDVANHIAHDMAKLFSVILHSSPDVLKELEAVLGQPVPKIRKAKQMRTIMKVLSLFQTMMRMLNLDAIHRHLIVCAFSFVHSSVDAMLKQKTVAHEDPKMATLHGCYVLLKLSEFMMAKTYASPPKGAHVNGLPYIQLGHFPDLVDTAILSHMKNGFDKGDDTFQKSWSAVDSQYPDDISKLSEEQSLISAASTHKVKLECQVKPSQR